MAVPTLRRRGRPPEDTQVASLRARAWYRCCVLESGAPNAAALAKMFRTGPFDERRSWERYASGKSLPSEIKKNSPAIVARVAQRFPRTLRVYASPLWIIIRNDHVFGVAETNELLWQLDREVWAPFFSTDKNGQFTRNWSYIQHEIWNEPKPALILDYLAAYLLLLKEARMLGHHQVEKSAEPWTQWALTRLPSCPILEELADELSALIVERMQITAPDTRLFT